MRQVTNYEMWQNTGIIDSRKIPICTKYYKCNAEKKSSINFTKQYMMRNSACAKKLMERQLSLQHESTTEKARQWYTVVSIPGTLCMMDLSVLPPSRTRHNQYQVAGANTCIWDCSGIAPVILTCSHRAHYWKTWKPEVSNTSQTESWPYLMCTKN